MTELLIRNGKIFTMSCQGILDGGELLIRNGKIAEVGSNLKIQAGLEIIDVEGGWVLPGLIDPHCHAGIFETAMGFSGNDGNEISSPVTPELRALDGVYPLDREFPLAVRYGVTTIATGPGSANPIGGQFLAMKTFGRTMETMIITESLAMKIAFGENPKNVYGLKNQQPVTRMATAALIREWLYKAQEYVEKKDNAGEDPAKLPSFDMKLEALEKVIRKQIPLKAHVHRCDDIMTALRIADEFGLDITLDHCTEGHLLAEELAARGKWVILGPFAGFPEKPELAAACLESAGILHRAGVRLAIMTDLPSNHLWFLPIAAGLCVRAGLPEEAGFRAITINAAESLGLAHRIGSLAPGKDADVAVFDGNPLKDLGSRCILTLIDGQVRYRL
jgi:imidazolonepropionase-like amidohydrolase